MKITKEMETALERVLKTIVVNYNRFMSGDEEHVVEMREEFAKGVKYDIGNKYIKISNGGSVHSFIVNTDTDKKFAYGDILKAASWASPARNKARGSVFNDSDIATRICWTGVNY